MRKPLLVLIFLVALTSLFGQNEIFHLVKIDISQKSLKELSKLGVEVDHGEIVPGKYITNIFSEYELKKIEEAGFKYKITITDVKDHYRKYGCMDHCSAGINARSSDCSEVFPTFPFKTPVNYRFGSMGGYLTLDEALAEFDRMRDSFPSLITEKTDIDGIMTHEGRFIYYLKISDNPDTDEGDVEPQILYDALHHAREPNSLSQLIFYMWYLLENYESNQEVQYLVNSTEMFFVPIVNPDGYKYNEDTDPQGGGLWRKNKWVNGEGDTLGVDLNRNYGFFWGHNDSGSSPEEDSNVFRGVGPFSEPETQAIRALCNANNFKVALNYHTFGNLLIHPWGYEDGPTAEDELFKSLGNFMTTTNDFFIGTALETVGYTVNGNSDDWMYGELEEKEKIYALTPEVGPTFWPSSDQIDFLNKSTVRMNLNAAHLLHHYVKASEVDGSNIIADESGTFFFELKREGLKDGMAEFALSSLNSGATLSNNEYGNLALSQGEVVPLTVDYSIGVGVEEGDTLRFELMIDHGDYISRDTIVKVFLQAEIDLISVYENNGSTIEDFTSVGTNDWNITGEHFFSPPFSITDSPNENYPNNAFSFLTTGTPIDLTTAESAFLKFSARWEIERDFDFVQVKGSSDGINFTPLCSSNMRAPSNFQSEVADGGLVYDGFQTEWIQEEICLDEFLGSETVYLQFFIFSDGGLTEDGFYFDDLRVEVSDPSLSSTMSIERLSFRLAPNPTRNMINISLDPADYSSDIIIQVSNNLGQIVMQEAFTRPSLDLDISTLARGSYFITLLNGRRPFKSQLILKE